MNCRNSEAYLYQAIESVYKQTFKNWEIILYDNDSIDNTEKIAKSFCSKLKYHKSPFYRNLYDARNQALSFCSGEIITFLDSDDIWMEDKLEIQLSKISKQNPIVAGGYYLIDGKDNITGLLLEKYKTKFYLKDIFLKNIISIGCLMITKDLINKYKFNSYYNLLGDFDLLIRLCFKNHIYYINRPLEKSRLHDGNFSKNNAIRWFKEESYFYIRLFKSNFKIIFNIWYLLFILKTNLKIFIYLIKNLFNLRNLFY